MAFNEKTTQLSGFSRKGDPLGRSNLLTSVLVNKPHSFSASLVQEGLSILSPYSCRSVTLRQLPPLFASGCWLLDGIKETVETEARAA